ncbi:hypothetical protein SprV_0401477600 [Sparganum proliferum]
MSFEDEAAQKLYRAPPGYGYQKTKQKPLERKQKRIKKVNVPEVLVVPPAPLPSAYSGAAISSFESSPGTETIVQEITKLSHPLNRPSLSAQGTVSDSGAEAETAVGELVQPSPLLQQSQSPLQESAETQSKSESEHPIQAELSKLSEQPRTAEVPAVASADAQIFDTKNLTALNNKSSANTSSPATVSRKSSSIRQQQITTPRPSQTPKQSGAPISTPPHVPTPPPPLNSRSSRKISGTPMQPKLKSNYSSKKTPPSTSASTTSAHSQAGSLKEVKTKKSEAPVPSTPKWTPPPPNSKKTRISNLGHRFSSMLSRLTGSPDIPDKKDLISAQSAAEIEQARAAYEEEQRRWQLEQQKKAQEAALRAKIERYLASKSGKKMLKRKQDEIQSVMRWTIRTLREFRRMRAALDELGEDFDPELLRKLRAVQMLEMLLTQQADSGNRSCQGSRSRSRSGSRCSSGNLRPFACHCSKHQSINTGEDPRSYITKVLVQKPNQHLGHGSRRDRYGSNSRCDNECRYRGSCEERRKRRRKKLCWTLVSMLQSRGIDVQAEIARDTAAMAESENEDQGMEVEPKTSLSVNAEQTQ